MDAHYVIGCYKYLINMCSMMAGIFPSAISSLGMRIETFSVSIVLDWLIPVIDLGKSHGALIYFPEKTRVLTKSKTTIF